MLNGKGYYIWQVARTEAGSVSAIVDRAKSANLKHLLIKIADGIVSFNITSSGDLVAPLVSALKANGIEPWGWVYVYGNDPNREAQKAIQRIQQTGVVGLVIDAESEYKQPGKNIAARTYMQALRSALPFFPIALSTYRYPTIHPEFPYLDFLNQCDYAMPQVYWAFSSQPRSQLTRSISEYRMLTSLPIIPTGAAYSERGWVPTTAEVVEFLDAARSHSLIGANFWEWYAARQIPNMWETIAAYNWPTEVSAPILSRGRVNTDLLNIRSGPGTSFTKVGSLKSGTRVTIFVLQDGWARISPDRELWVAAEYLARVP